MKIYRIEHNILKIGPIILPHVLLETHNKKEPNTQNPLTPKSMTAISFAQSLVGGGEERPPFMWNTPFGEWWEYNNSVEKNTQKPLSLKEKIFKKLRYCHTTKTQKNFKNRKDYLFGFQSGVLDQLLDILKSQKPYSTPEQKNVFVNLHKNENFSFHSYEMFGKNNLLNLGSTLWRSVFQTPIADGRLIIVEYEASEDFHEGGEQQIAFNKHFIKSRKILWFDEKDCEIDLCIASQKLFESYESHKNPLIAIYDRLKNKQKLESLERKNHESLSHRA